MHPAASKTEMMTHVRGLLRDVLHLRAKGSSYPRLARAQGYLDGYMQLMQDAGIAGHDELLELVRGERRAVDGPPSTAWSLDDAQEFAA